MTQEIAIKAQAIQNQIDDLQHLQNEKLYALKKNYIGEFQGDFKKLCDLPAITGLTKIKNAKGKTLKECIEHVEKQYDDALQSFIIALKEEVNQL